MVAPRAGTARGRTRNTLRLQHRIHVPDALRGQVQEPGDLADVEPFGSRWDRGWGPPRASSPSGQRQRLHLSQVVEPVPRWSSKRLQLVVEVADVVHAEAQDGGGLGRADVGTVWWELASILDDGKSTGRAGVIFGVAHASPTHGPWIIIHYVYPLRGASFTIPLANAQQQKGQSSPFAVLKAVRSG